jgi:hypothetical protein
MVLLDLNCEAGPNQCPWRKLHGITNYIWRRLVPRAQVLRNLIDLMSEWLIQMTPLMRYQLLQYKP